MTDAVAGDASQWAPCHCCGRSFPADSVVRFEKHPEDALCVGCAQWLNDLARPMARRYSRPWQLPARLRRSRQAAGSQPVSPQPETRIQPAR